MGRGHTIVTVLCDGGAKYQSRLFNKAWIAERGFLEAIKERSLSCLRRVAQRLIVEPGKRGLQRYHLAHDQQRRRFAGRARDWIANGRQGRSDDALILQSCPGQ